MGRKNKRYFTAKNTKEREEELEIIHPQGIVHLLLSLVGQTLFLSLSVCSLYSLSSRIFPPFDLHTFFSASDV